MANTTASANRCRSALQPPRVPGLPVLGNTLQLLKDPAGFFPKAQATYGPIFRVNVARTDYTVLAGREAFDFYNEVGEQYFSRAAFYERFGQEMGTDRFILGQPPDQQRDLRRKMRLGLSRQVTSSYISQMVRAAEHAIDQVPEGGTVRPMRFAAAVSLEQYGQVLCGQSLGSVFSDARRYTQFIMNVGTKLWPELVLHAPSYKRSRRKVFEVTHRLLREARQSFGQTERDCLLHALLSAESDEGGPLAEQDVVSCALYGFVGTLVYVNRAVSFLLYHLLADNELYQRVTQEADTVFADGPPDVEALRRMTLLRTAFKESLRRHPIALALPFCAEADFDFHGYRVRQGDYVVLSAVTGHFSESYYRCPYAFDPDRLRAPRNEHRNRGAYVPFGFGARACPAAGLVELMTLCTVGPLLHRRRVRLHPPGRALNVTLNPLPGPTRGFRTKFLEHRQPETPPTQAPTDDEALTALLSGDGQEKLERFLARIVSRTYQPGETIIREGDTADEFFVISQGVVDVVRDSGAEAQRLARLEAGQYFGEIALLGAGVRTASCLAAGSEPVRVLVIRRADFVEMVETSDLVSDEIATIARRRFVANRLQEAIPRAASDHIVGLMDEADVERHAPGQTIIRQGDPAEAFYIILKGTVEVVTEDHHGAPSHLAELTAGQFFGETGILRGQPRNATVHATGDQPVELLVIGRDVFLRLVQQSPAAHKDIASVMGQRVLETLGDADA